MAHQTIVVWLRNALRLEDNPALFHAVDDARQIIPVFVWSPQDEGNWPLGTARQWWLQEALTALADRLQTMGSRLVIRKGDAIQELADLVRTTGATAVYHDRRYDPAGRNVQESACARLRSEGTDCRCFDGSLLHEPDQVRTSAGSAYRVFTPFWKRLIRELRLPEPLPRPPLSPACSPEVWPGSHSIDDLHLATADVASRLSSYWTVTEDAAAARLETFLEERIAEYASERDVPSEDATSKLSPYLAGGQISPLQVWHETMKLAETDRSVAMPFLRQLAWREFGNHLLHHFPHTTDRPLNERFENFAWRDDEQALGAWRRGETGYPIIDAAMRQLQETGWMHNRMRMLTASFLTKDLMIPWQHGARIFWDRAVDADLANNTLGWQWAAGSGADAQPYFRIFNPITQGMRFDADGRYVRRFIPELRDLPDAFIHRPWEAPKEVLQDAGITLGRDYPAPVVDHTIARQAALAAYEEVR